MGGGILMRLRAQVVAVAVAAVVVATAGAASAATKPAWVDAWGAAPHSSAAETAVPTFANQTLRLIVQQATGDEIIAGYRQIVDRVHAKHAKIFGATLTPVEGSGRYTAVMERERQKINTWIRTSGAFDGVIDFDQATQDPADPLRFLPAYDSGDHLHPGDKGYQAMAAAIDLNLFR